jgi:poly(3-hydroxybutyrate) depolymerase
MGALRLIEHVAIEHMRLVIGSLLLCCMSSLARAESAAETIEHVATLRSLFPAEQVASLSDILPPDRQIHFKLFVPSGSERNGVLVFVHATDSAEPQPGWTRVLQQHRVIWVAAERFGNSVPAAQRVLAALLGLAHVQRTYAVDRQRIYIAGMSGGGRVASRTITQFPTMFRGAIYIVGADPLDDAAQREVIAANRYVFLTGHKDFNRREMRSIHRRYAKAGVKDTLWLDFPAFGHEYPSPVQLERAIQFLDTGVDSEVTSDE